MPGQTSSALVRWTEPTGKPSTNSSGIGCMLSQMPFSAISLAVASSISMPCSIHLHAGRDGPLDRSRRKGMHGDVSAPILGRFNRGAQFGLGEGGHVDRTEG